MQRSIFQSAIGAAFKLQIKALEIMFCEYFCMYNMESLALLTGQRCNNILLLGAMNVLITNPLWVVNTRIKMQDDSKLKGLLRKCPSVCQIC